MKGIQKTLQRTPHLFTSSVGMSNKSSDPAFDELNRRFTTMEKAIDFLLKDAVVYRSNVQNMLASQVEFAKGFSTILQPMGADEDAYGSEQRESLQAKLATLDFYSTHMADLKESLQPEIDLIDSRVITPARELQTLMKGIRKSITKRDHKLLDYDRHNNSLKKLKEKSNKTLKDEQNLFKLESDFEAATAEYEHYSSLLKTDLPRFFELVGEFMYPLSTSLFFMQLNIYYLSVEKFKLVNEELERQGVSEPGSSSGTMESIVTTYTQKRGTAVEDMDKLLCIRGAKSTTMFVRQYKERNGGLAGGDTRPSSTTRPSYSKSESYGSKADSMGGLGATRFTAPSAGSAAPPPAYSAPAGVGGGAASAGYGSATKRAPPPPPPVANRPKAPAQYVLALYDYAAQAEGDLSFSAGDRIELLKKTESENDWWTGRLRGQEGIFPGNYVQMA